MKQFGATVTDVVRSRGFFWAIMLLFGMEAAWIAISARFPMAFDEDTHLGIIKLYAQQWSPLFAHQVPGPAPYGALTRDPSYLYHWLMSWPYRWLASWLSNQMLVVILLRFINIALFASGLVLFRKLMLRAKASAAIVHTTLLFFVLVPVVPLLAGQVNYDNLLMLLVPLNVLFALWFRDRLLKTKKCSAVLLLNTVSLGMLGSLVKFAYLPIFTAVVVYIMYVLWRFAGSMRKSADLWHRHWQVAPNVHKLSAGAVFVVSLGLFLQMYGVNIVKYHNIIPQCGQVLRVERCMAYGPWARNYLYAQNNTSHGGNPMAFAGGWVWGMFDRSFFAINGPNGPAPYDNKSPLPVISMAAIGVFGLGALLLWRYRRQVFFGNAVLNLMLFVSGIYLVALVGRNYHDYWQLGHLVAINGRYLVLIMLPILLAMALAYRQFLSRQQAAVLLVVVYLLFLQGGGTVTFIYSSNAYWYWPGSPWVQRLNERAQQIIRPFIVHWPSRH